MENKRSVEMTSKTIKAVCTYHKNAKDAVELGAMDDCWHRGAYWSFSVPEFNLYAENSTDFNEKSQAQDIIFNKLCDLGYEETYCEVTIIDGIRPNDPYVSFKKIVRY